MLRSAILSLTILASSLSAPALRPLQAAEAPFETRLLRLSEILGSLHYLRNLCGEAGTKWRDEMEAMLRAENPEPAMRARYVSSFNSGYRAFSAGYASCTESAYAAIGRYMKEGETLSRDIAVRFGN
jgi:uncharacterized protein (TIGR02301 family)